MELFDAPTDKPSLLYSREFDERTWFLSDLMS